MSMESSTGEILVINGEIVIRIGGNSGFVLTVGQALKMAELLCQAATRVMDENAAPSTSEN